MPNRLTILVPNYEPAFKAGGPLRSVKGIVAALGTDWSTRVITSAYDQGEDKMLPDVIPDRWVWHGSTRVWYASRPNMDRSVLKAMGDSTPDLWYFNSFFSRTFSIRPRLRTILSRNSAPVLIAPRGDLLPGPMRMRRIRKAVFTKLASCLGMYKRIGWHATEENEAEAIRTLFGKQSQIFLATNIPTLRPSKEPIRDNEKHAGQLRLLYVSRIGPKKGLKEVVSTLTSVCFPWRLDIYGEGAGTAYGCSVKKTAQAAGVGDRIHFHGPVPQATVAEKMRDADALVLWTRGENYGHAIVEALSVGCPVITSQHTPWSDLEREGAGWIVPLGDGPRMRQVLHEIADMDQEACSYRRRHALKYVVDRNLWGEAVRANASMFHRALAKIGETR